MLFLVLSAPLFTFCACSAEPLLSTDNVSDCRQRNCIGTIVQVLLQLSEATAPQKSMRWNSIALKLSDKEKRPSQRTLEALTAARLTPTECNRYAMLCCTACMEDSSLTAPFGSQQTACIVAKRHADLNLCSILVLQSNQPLPAALLQILLAMQGHISSSSSCGMQIQGRVG